MRKPFTFVVAAAALGVATIAFAQTDNSLRVRGSVSAIDGNELTVKTTAGQTAKVKLDATYNVLLYTPIRLEDVAPNAYVAAASAPQPDGSLRALAVVVFPEGMRGLNEGTKGWDLTPSSRMTNATIAQLVEQGDGREITVRFDGDETQRIMVPERTPMASFGPADNALLKVDASVVVFATRNPDGSLSSSLIGVGKEGYLPPI